MAARDTKTDADLVTIAPRLLSAERAAKYLGLGRSSFYELVVPHVPVIKASPKSPSKFDVRDLDAWIESRKQPPKVPAPAPEAPKPFKLPRALRRRDD